MQQPQRINQADEMARVDQAGFVAVIAIAAKVDLAYSKTD